MLTAQPSFTTCDPCFGWRYWQAWAIRVCRRLTALWLEAFIYRWQCFSQNGVLHSFDEKAQTSQSSVQTAVRDTRVLIVEDESIVALELKMSLRRLGHDVVAVAGNAADAIYLAGVHRPDVILMDIRLKGKIDGIDAAATIRMQWDVPLIFVTGQADEATMQRAQKVGPAAYLNKPIAASDLSETIELVVGRHKQMKNRTGLEDR